MSIQLPDDFVVKPYSVNDSYKGELYGYKEVQFSGLPVAAADVNIFGNEVQIQDIVTREGHKRKGYATVLVRDLFREFPDKKIFVSNMTEEGAAFFRKTFCVHRTGRITEKIAKPRPAPHAAAKTRSPKLGI